MSAAPLLQLRQAIVSHLRADVVLTALVPDERVYGERTPARLIWPFVRYGIADAQPGHLVRLPIHCFSKGTHTDECAGIVEQIGNSLDGICLTLDSGYKAHLALLGSRILPDPEEASAWHGIADIEARIQRDCDDR